MQMKVVLLWDTLALFMVKYKPTYNVYASVLRPSVLDGYLYFVVK